MSLTFSRQGHRHANEPVFHQVREVARVVSVYAEVVGVHRPEERIVRVLVVLPFRLQRIEPGSGSRGRELEAIRRHVAVGAGASVAAEFFEIAVVEGCTTSRHRIARRLVAIEMRSRRFRSGSCPKPVCGMTAAIIPMKAKAEDAMSRACLQFVHVCFSPFWVFRELSTPAQLLTCKRNPRGNAATVGRNFSRPK